MIGRGRPPSLLYDFLFLAGLIGIFIVFIYPPYGNLYLTYDSNDYIAASKSIDSYLHGKNQDGHSYLIRPPLLPAYLYFFQNKILACWWLNLISYAASLALCLRLGRLLNVSGIFLYGCVAIIGMTYPWVQNYFFLLTEPLFSALILFLTCVFLEKKSLFAVVSVCVIAILLRKAGLFLVGTIACLYLVNREYKKFFTISLVSGLLLIGLESLTLHFSHFSTLVGVFTDSAELSRIHYLDVVSSWMWPRFFSINIRALLIILALSITMLFYNSIIRTYLNIEAIRNLFALIIGYVLCFVVLFGVPDYDTAERFLTMVIL